MSRSTLHCQTMLTHIRSLFQSPSSNRVANRTAQHQHGTLYTERKHTPICRRCTCVLDDRLNTGSADLHRIVRCMLQRWTRPWQLAEGRCERSVRLAGKWYTTVQQRNRPWPSFRRNRQPHSIISKRRCCCSSDCLDQRKALRHALFQRKPTQDNQQDSNQNF